MQCHGRESLDEEGMEREGVIRKPVERGWGIWCQADVIAAKVRERQTERSGEGVVIEMEGSLRVSWVSG